MLQITCPWCGPRAESEFSCGGEAHIARPLDTDALTDEQWGDYLFMRKNPKGLAARKKYFWQSVAAQPGLPALVQCRAAHGHLPVHEVLQAR